MSTDPTKRFLAVLRSQHCAALAQPRPWDVPLPDALLEAYVRNDLGAEGNAAVEHAAISSPVVLRQLADRLHRLEQPTEGLAEYAEAAYAETGPDATALAQGACSDSGPTAFGIAGEPPSALAEPALASLAARLFECSWARNADVAHKAVGTLASRLKASSVVYRAQAKPSSDQQIDDSRVRHSVLLRYWFGLVLPGVRAQLVERLDTHEGELWLHCENSHRAGSLVTVTVTGTRAARWTAALNPSAGAEATVVDLGSAGDLQEMLVAGATWRFELVCYADQAADTP